jgi:hypothetical protein
MDDSRIEHNAIKSVFGEGVRPLLCTVHSIRKIQEKLGHFSETAKLLRKAIFAYTRDMCGRLIDQAIKALPPLQSGSSREYIERQWYSRMEMWSMFARQHSPLLLQVSTTNWNESYHRDIKRTPLRHKFFVQLADVLIRNHNQRKANMEKAERVARNTSCLYVRTFFRFM